MKNLKKESVMQNKYFTTRSLEDGNVISLDVRSFFSDGVAIGYSKDGGNNWKIEVVKTQRTLKVKANAGDEIMWKVIYGRCCLNFNATKKFEVEGNIMSLAYGDDFADKTELTQKNIFNGLFAGSETLVNAGNLVLAATRLTDWCYEYMFGGCTSLTTAPSILPATTLARDCYCNMFWGCTSLTTAPELATTLTEDCYYYMFYGCTSLQNKPA